jgi:hypothetical protein
MTFLLSLLLLSACLGIPYAILQLPVFTPSVEEPQDDAWTPVDPPVLHSVFDASRGAWSLDTWATKMSPEEFESNWEGRRLL